MTNPKRILITTESREIFILRVNGGGVGEKAVREFCPACESETELLTLDAAVSVSGIPALDIIREAQTTGEIHFWETANGHLLFCRNSLENISSDAIINLRGDRQ